MIDLESTQKTKLAPSIVVDEYGEQIANYNRGRALIGTQKLLFPEMLAGVWAVRDAITFCQGILQQDNHIFIFSPAHRLLESAIKLQMRAILGAWRIVWSNFGGILLFGAKPLARPIFLLDLKTAFFEAHLLSS